MTTLFHLWKILFKYAKTVFSFLMCLELYTLECISIRYITVGNILQTRVDVEDLVNNEKGWCQRFGQ